MVYGEVGGGLLSLGKPLSHGVGVVTGAGGVVYCLSVYDAYVVIRVFFLVVNACNKKLLCDKISLGGGLACKRHSRLPQKRISWHDYFFVVVFTAKQKLHDVTISLFLRLPQEKLIGSYRKGKNCTILPKNGILHACSQIGPILILPRALRRWGRPQQQLLCSPSAGPKVLIQGEWRKVPDSEPKDASSQLQCD